MLNDAERLRDYYNSKFGGTIKSANILATTLDLGVGIELKEEYIIYINRYGVPENLQFESEKLSPILLEIQNRDN